MKSYIITIILSFIFAASLMAGSSVGIAGTDTYIDDIPFNTSIVASTTDNHDLFVKLMVMDEEMPADDIPFNTAWVLIMHQMNFPGIQFEEEAYVDDIPFNTELIASNALVDQLTYEEETVDDIPFETLAIYNEVMTSKLVSNYTDEAEADDIPFDTELIASNALLDQGLVEDYTFEESVDDFPFDNIDDFLLMAFNGYYNEKPVNDIPFDTEEIFCANVCCEKNKRKIRFTRNISTAQHSYTSTALIQSEGKIGLNNLGSIIDSIEKLWVLEISSTK